MDSLMTVTELSEYLKIPKSTIYKMSCAKVLPLLKVGGHLRFNRPQIDEWLASHSFCPAF
jgi:excisionase family DNA binding protein